MKIWRVITDFSGYQEWWPAPLKTKALRVAEGLIGSRIEIRPYGGKGFVCEVVDVKHDSELRMKYSGIYSGTGVWTISDVNEHCRVTYEIMLEIENFWILLLSSFVPVTKIHSRLMSDVLSGLEQYLANTIEKE